VDRQLTGGRPVLHTSNQSAEPEVSNGKVGGTEADQIHAYVEYDFVFMLGVSITFSGEPGR
jgi:hypothetical protein